MLKNSLTQKNYHVYAVCRNFEILRIASSIASECHISINAHLKNYAGSLSTVTSKKSSIRGFRNSRLQIFIRSLFENSSYRLTMDSNVLRPKFGHKHTLEQQKSSGKVITLNFLKTSEKLLEGKIIDEVIRDIYLCNYEYRKQLSQPHNYRGDNE